MQCVRCAGTRVPEVIAEGGSRVLAFRCIHCGDITDRVIAKNRQQPRLIQQGRPRTPIYVPNSSKWNGPTFG
ncbi:MAG: hypothetical protein H8K04_01410 [Nitrospira sp.]